MRSKRTKRLQRGSSNTALQLDHVPQLNSNGIQLTKKTVMTISKIPVSPATRKAMHPGLPDLGIYVECLATRNNGNHHGHWIDLEHIENKQQLQDCIDLILTTSSAHNPEEWEITDWSIPSFVAQTQDLNQILQFLTHRKSRVFWEEQQAYDQWCSEKCWIFTDEDWDKAFQGFHVNEATFAEDAATDAGHNTGHYSEYLNWSRIYEGEYDCNGFRSYPVVMERKDYQGNRLKRIAVFAPI